MVGWELSASCFFSYLCSPPPLSINCSLLHLQPVSSEQVTKELQYYAESYTHFQSPFTLFFSPLDTPFPHTPFLPSPPPPTQSSMYSVSREISGCNTLSYHSYIELAFMHITRVNYFQVPDETLSKLLFFVYRLLKHWIIWKPSSISFTEVCSFSLFWVAVWLQTCFQLLLYNVHELGFQWQATTSQTSVLLCWSPVLLF